MPNFNKSRGFKLKSGNKMNMSSFKMMGSSSTMPSPITARGLDGTTPKGKNSNFNVATSSKEEIIARQKELGVTADGIWGPNSKAAEAKATGTDTKTNVTDVKNNTKKEVTTDPAADDDSSELKVKRPGLGGILAGALTSGLDAVYGTGKVMPASARLIKKKDDKNSSGPSKTAKELLAGVTGFPTDSKKLK